MRTGLAYTSARILMLIVSGIVLYLCGARGLLLLVLAFLVSGIASYILLSRQRDKMAGALNRRLNKATGKVTGKATELKERLEEGTAAEDDANDNAAARDAEADSLPTRTAP
jgi:membrane protein implicated in regulation of membrane protease activity